MTPVAQKFLLSANDGTLYTGVDLAQTTALTKVTGLPSNVGPWLVHYGFDKFVAISKTQPENIWYSSDGASWVQTPLTSSQKSYINTYFGSAVRISYSGGWWFCTIQGGLLVSNDGVSWVPYPFAGGTTGLQALTTDVVYRPESSTWFVGTANGDIAYCTGPDPSVSGAWVRKAGVASQGFYSMAYGYDPVQGVNVFNASSSNANYIYRSLDGYNWVQNIAVIPAAISNVVVRYIRTNDATKPHAWFYVGSSGSTLKIGYTNSPYTVAINWTSYSMALAGQVFDVLWDDTNFGFFGQGASGGSSFGPVLQTMVESISTTISGLSPNGAFPSAATNYAVSGSIFLPDVAPTTVVPASGASVTTPGPSLSATIARSTAADYYNAQWQIDTVNTFNSINLRTINSPIINGSMGVQTFALPPSQALTTNGTYYIRARSIGVDGPISPWSTTTSFTVTLTAVSVPTSPTATALSDYWPTFGATMSSYGSGRSKLEFQYASDAAFTNIISSYLQPDTYYSSSAIANPSPYRNPDTSFVFGSGTYYFRVRQVSEYGLVSAWTSAQAFTTAIALPLLTGTTVVSGGYPVGSKVITAPTGVIATSHPTISWLANTNKNMANYPRVVHMQIQTASDSGFTTNLTSTDAARSNDNGLDSGNVYIASRIVPGTVYVRGVLIDQLGMQSTTYTDTGTFSIAHPPVSLPMVPANGAIVNYDASGQVFTWTFNDTSSGDTQTAFQVIALKVSDGSTVYDSGKITNTTSSLQAVISSTYKGVTLAWQVRTWDTDDNAGPYSTPRTVTFADPPAVTITSPTNGSTVTTGRPTITWTIGGTAPQRSYVVTIIDVSGSSTLTTVAWTSRGTVGMSVTPPLNVLDNTHSYTVRVDVITSLGSVATSSANFTASYVPPATPVYVVDASVYDQFGYIDVNWAGTVPDLYFYTWTVWRRNAGDTSFTQLYVTTNPTITDYQDWSALTGVYYEYIVTQDADRSGILLGSSISTPNPAVVSLSGSWWFIDPTDATNNISITVTQDSWTDEYEENTYAIIGRGRAKDVGTHLGYTGSLTGTIRPDDTYTAKQRYEKLREMRKQNKRIQMRDAFGNIFNVAIGVIVHNHTAGVGSTEMYEVTIPVDEVII